MTAFDTTGRPSRAALARGWDDLRDRGLLAPTAFDGRRAAELGAVRSVAATDLALGRVYDGHRNGLERVLVHRPGDVPDAVRTAVATGDVSLGVWGADPGPDDGPPARLSTRAGAPVVSGVKTFCSGAGLLDLAIVLVRRTSDAPPILPVLVDLRTPGAIDIDEQWYASPALRESCSDRVVFNDAPVLAVLGGEGALSAEPWISGDALRSTAVWAGGVDAILHHLVDHARARDLDAVDLERLGRADAIRAACDVWLAAGLVAVDGEHRDPDRSAAPAIAAMRLELTARIRELLTLSAELTGSRGLVAVEGLASTRMGLDVLLLQHRLGPVAQRRGRALVDAAAR